MRRRKTRTLAISFFFFSSRRRHTRYIGDWSSDVCSSDLIVIYDSAGLPLNRTPPGAFLRLVLDLADSALAPVRSEERRVGKECRARRAPRHQKKNYMHHHTIAGANHASRRTPRRNEQRQD